MKKRFILGSILLGFLALTGCTKDNTPVEAKSLPLYDKNSSYELVNNTLDTYYIDGSSVPYVSVAGYINSMNGILKSDTYSFAANTLFKEYIVKASISGTQVSIIFDYGNKKILTAYLNAFQNTVDITQTIDYSFNLKSSTSSYYPGNTISFDLGKYDLDMRYINGNCLVPFQVMNALFGCENYCSTYYTGNSYYNVYFSTRYEDDGAETYKLMKADYNTSIDSQEVRDSNYNFMCFYFDYFYGLKEYKKINSFDEYFAGDIKTALKSTDYNEYMKGYALVIQKLNELHTSLHNQAYTSDLTLSFVEGDYTASNFVKFGNTRNQLRTEAKKLYGDELKNNVSIVDNTCYIFFTGFDTAANAKVKDSSGNILSDAYLYDTYYLFYKAFDEIKKSSTKVENVVVDLSCNGGGNSGAQMRALGFIARTFTESNRISINNSCSISSCRVDTNNDGVYDNNDGYPDYNWFILTSFNSYSSANIFTHNAKLNNSNVKIIGEAAGGGGCSILPFIGIDGTAMQFSGDLQMVSVSTRGTSYSYEVLETGHKVDYAIDYQYYYDRTYLTNYLNSLK